MNEKTSREYCDERKPPDHDLQDARQTGVYGVLPTSSSASSSVARSEPDIFFRIIESQKLIATTPLFPRLCFGSSLRINTHTRMIDSFEQMSTSILETRSHEINISTTSSSHFLPLNIYSYLLGSIYLREENCFAVSHTLTHNLNANKFLSSP